MNVNEKREISKMSERELKEGMYYNLRHNLKQTKRISNNVSFMFWLTIVNLLGILVYLAQ